MNRLTVTVIKLDLAEIKKGKFEMTNYKIEVYKNSIWQTNKNKRMQCNSKLTWEIRRYESGNNSCRLSFPVNCCEKMLTDLKSPGKL